MAALVGLMFASMTADRQTKSRLDGTRDEQFTAVYFAGDVQGRDRRRRRRNGTVWHRHGRHRVSRNLLQPGATPCRQDHRGELRLHARRWSTESPTGRLERRSCEAPASPAPTYPLSPDHRHELTVARTLSAATPVPTLHSCTVRHHHKIRVTRPDEARHRSRIHASRHEESDMTSRGSKVWRRTMAPL